MYEKAAYLFFMTLAAAAIWMYSCPVAILVLVFSYSIFVMRVFMPNLDKFMHTKLFIIPDNIKCAITINCKKRSCQARNEMESQANGDFDLLSVGHIVFWALATFFEPKITFFFVLILSTAWEVFEALMGCAGFVIHARLTDILLNITGYTIGMLLRTFFKKQA